MQLSEEKIPMESAQVILDKRKQIRKKIKNKGIKNRLFLLGVIFTIVLMSVMYFFSEASNVYKVHVVGNNYVSKDEIIAYSKIKKNSKYLFVQDFLVTQNVNKHPFIVNSYVTHERYNVINIEVVERKPFAYRVSDEIIVYTTDYKEIVVEFENELLARLPMIAGFEDEEVMKEVGKSFDEVKEHIISSIALITQYPQSYDQNMMQLLMRDGNTVFVSIFSTEVLNQYFDIISSVEGVNNCIFIEDISKNAYKSICPWDNLEENKETEEKTDENSFTNNE